MAAPPPALAPFPNGNAVARANGQLAGVDPAAADRRLELALPPLPRRRVPDAGRLLPPARRRPWGALGSGSAGQRRHVGRLERFRSRHWRLSVGGGRGARAALLPTPPLPNDSAGRGSARAGRAESLFLSSKHISADLLILYGRCIVLSR